MPTWKEIEETEGYQNSGVMKRRLIRESFFKNFVSSRPDFPIDNPKLAKEIEDGFVGREDTVPLPPVKPTPEALPIQPQTKPKDMQTWEIKQKEEGPLYPIKQGAWGSAHTTAVALDAMTFGASSKGGLAKEPIEDILRKRGATDKQINTSRAYGEFVGTAAQAALLWEYGGGAALAKTLQIPTYTAKYSPILNKAGAPIVEKFVTQPARKFYANAAGWAVTGFEYGGARKAMEETFNAIKTQNPDFEKRLKSVGFAGIEGAASFALIDMVVGGVLKGGSAALKTKLGQAGLDAIKKAGSGAVERVAAFYEAHATPTGRAIATSAKAEGKTYSAKVKELTQALESEAKAQEPKWWTQYEFGDVSKPNAIIFDQFARDARLGEHGYVSPTIQSPKIITEGEGFGVSVKNKKAVYTYDKRLIKDVDIMGIKGQGYVIIKMGKEPAGPLFGEETVSGVQREMRVKAIPINLESAITKTILEWRGPLNTEAEQQVFVDYLQPKMERLFNVKIPYKVLVEKPGRTFMPGIGGNANITRKTVRINKGIGFFPEEGVLDYKGDPIKTWQDYFRNDFYEQVEFAPFKVDSALEKVARKTTRGWAVDTNASRKLALGHEVLHHIYGALDVPGRGGSGAFINHTEAFNRDVGKVMDALFTKKTVSKGAETIFEETKGKQLEFAFGDRTGNIYTGWAGDIILDTVTNLKGASIEIQQGVKHIAKSVGTPFFIAEKYPAFKPIYRAVQDSLYQRNEIFNASMSILNTKSLSRLSQSAKDKVVMAIKLVNTSKEKSLQRWFTPEELKNNYGFGNVEIKAYTQIKRLYEYATNVEIRTRLKYLQAEELYVNAPPEEQIKMVQKVRNEVSKLGGYVSTTRGNGKWIIYKPSAKPETPPEFFNTYESLSDAEKVGKVLGVKPFLKKELGARDLYNKLSIQTLESLVEDAGVDVKSADVKAIMNELKKRGFSSHWIQRRYIEGYDWTFENVVNSAVDYAQGASNKYARSIGRSQAETFLIEGMRNKSLTPELQDYAKRYIGAFYDTGRVGWEALSKLAYVYRLAAKTSWLATNMVQPFFTTYPKMSKYYKAPLLQELAFNAAFNKVDRYFTPLWGGRGSLTSEYRGFMDKLRRQGVFLDQQQRFELGKQDLLKGGWDKFISSFGVVGEARNRAHAATIAYDIATRASKSGGLGLTDRSAILSFARNFVELTQYPYGKHNMPLAILEAGNMKNWARSLYTFRHYNISYMQYLASTLPSRGGNFGEFTRAMGGYLAATGVKGLIGYNLIDYGYSKLTGHTIEGDLRGFMQDKIGSDRIKDSIVGGMAYSAGVDMSGMLGLGDVFPTFGDVAEKLMGAGLATPYKIGKGVVGMVGAGVEYGMGSTEVGKRKAVFALEDMTPDFVNRLIKGYRYSQEGVRTRGGDPVFLQPSQIDKALTSLGFTSNDVSKAWAKRQAIEAMNTKISNGTASLNEREAWALMQGDADGVRRIRIQRAGRGVPVRGSTQRRTIKERIKKLRNIQRRPGYRGLVEREIQATFKEEEEGEE